MDFTERFNNYSNSQLLEVIKNPNDYQPESFETAEAIISSRQLTKDELEKDQGSLLSKHTDDDVKEQPVKDTFLESLVEKRILENKNAIIETLINSQNDEYWRDYIHAFGVAQKESDLDKLFKVFSTLSEGESTIVLNCVKQKAAKLVLKVTMCGNDGGSKFIWENAKVLSVIHNPFLYQLPDTISIAHYSWLQGLPEKSPCIVYLVPFPLGSEEPSDIGRWILLEGDGHIGSVSYCSK